MLSEESETDKHSFCFLRTEINQRVDIGTQFKLLNTARLSTTISVSDVAIPQLVKTYFPVSNFIFTM